jgi:hypothetical protein
MQQNTAQALHNLTLLQQPDIVKILLPAFPPSLLPTAAKLFQPPMCRTAGTALH